MELEEQPLSFDEIEDFCDYLLVEKGSSLNTIESYRRDLRLFGEYATALGTKGLTDVERSHVMSYLAYCRKQDLSPTTISRKLSTLRSFYKFLILDKVIAKNPTVNLESPKLGRYLPNVMTQEETELLLNQADLSTPIGKRDKAILETLYATGMRVSELTNLAIDDVNFTFHYAKVFGKGGKERLVPVGSYALDALSVYIKEVRPLFLKDKINPSLFLGRYGSSLTRQMIWTMLKKYGKSAGIGDMLSPHVFRHSMAAHLLENGADLRVVQEILGHADIATTQIYTQVLQKTMTAEFKKYHPRS